MEEIELELSKEFNIAKVYSLTNKTDSIVEFFGIEKQKQKLIEEILELEISTRNLCLLYQNTRTKSVDITTEEFTTTELQLKENIVEELADVTNLCMQVKKFGFKKMYEMVYRKNSVHLDLLARNGFTVDRDDVYAMVEKKVDRTLERYSVPLITRKAVYK